MLLVSPNKSSLTEGQGRERGGTALENSGTTTTKMCGIGRVTFPCSSFYPCLQLLLQGQILES